MKWRQLIIIAGWLALLVWLFSQYDGENDDLLADLVLALGFTILAGVAIMAQTSVWTPALGIPVAWVSAQFFGVLFLFRIGMMDLLKQLTPVQLRMNGLHTIVVSFVVGLVPVVMEGIIRDWMARTNIRPQRPVILRLVVNLLLGMGAAVLPAAVTLVALPEKALSTLGLVALAGGLIGLIAFWRRASYLVTVMGGLSAYPAFFVAILLIGPYFDVSGSEIDRLPLSGWLPLGIWSAVVGLFVALWPLAFEAIVAQFADSNPVSMQGSNDAAH